MYIKRAESVYGDDASFIGFPRRKKSGAYFNNSYLYINANSVCTKEINRFFEYILSEEGQRILTENDTNLSVRRDIFEEKVVKYQENADGNITESDGIFTWSNTPLTSEEIMVYENVYENALPVDKRLNNVIIMIEEELGACMADQKSAEETARIIDSRVQLYLDENR